jgi:hypothetical protein
MKHEVLKAKHQALYNEIDNALQRATADLTEGRYNLLETCQSSIHPDETIEQFEVMPDGLVEIITVDEAGEDQNYPTYTDGMSLTDLLFVLEQIETDKISPEEND